MPHLHERLAAATLRPVADADAAREVVARIHARLGRDAPPLRLWDGTTLGRPDAPFRLALASPSSLRALLPVSDLAAGEAYVAGLVDVEGDAVAAMHAVRHLVDDARLSPLALARIGVDLLRLPVPAVRAVPPRAELAGAPHSRERDAAAIRFHYDVGNAFYRLFLDDHLVYSCAMYASPDEPLELAQSRKLDVVCRKLRLGPGSRLLDVGCGWGSLAIHAARHHGARVTGVTLSTEQHDLARERVGRAGLADRVEIRLEDYRDVRGTWDAIASIGMAEHVGPQALRGYFTALRGLLAEGGGLLNHAITTGRRMRPTDYTDGPPSFAAAHVFPDGGLVPAWEMVRHVEHSGLELRDVEQLRPSYALTLRAWLGRLEQAWDEAVRLAGEPTARVWRIYLAAAAAMFEAGDLGVVQVLGTTPTGHGPLGRRWMGPADVVPGA